MRLIALESNPEICLTVFRSLIDSLNAGGGHVGNLSEAMEAGLDGYLCDSNCTTLIVVRTANYDVAGVNECELLVLGC